MKICQKPWCSCQHHRLIECMRKKENEEAEGMLKQLVNGPDLRDKEGLTLLHYSVRFGNVDITKYLLQNGYNVDAQENDGTTALMQSVRSRDMTISEILLSHDADIYLKGPGNCSALELAVRQVFDFFNLKTIEVCKTILEMFVARVERELATDQRLPYSYDVKLALVTMGSKDIAEFLLKRGFSMFKEKMGWDPLEWTMLLVRPENFALLLDWRGDEIYGDARGFAQHYLKRFARIDREKKVLRVWMRLLSEKLTTSESNRHSIKLAIEIFLTEGEKEDVKTVLPVIETNKRVLRSGLVHFLVQNPNDDVMQILEEPGMRWDVHACRIDRKTALMAATYHHRLANMRFLLYHGAHVDVRARHGETVLSEALVKVERNEVSTTTLCATWQLLLQHGAYVQRRFRGVGSVMDLCRRYADLQKVVLAHLALLGSREPPTLKPELRAEIDADPTMKPYFDLCTEQLEQMKNITVLGRVTFWKLLTGTEAQLLGYARYVDLKDALNTVMPSYMHLDPYYIDSLNEIVDKTINRLTLEREASRSIANMNRLCHDFYYDVYRLVFEYLSLSDLYNVIKSGVCV